MKQHQKTKKKRRVTAIVVLTAMIMQSVMPTVAAQQYRNISGNGLQKVTPSDAALSDDNEFQKASTSDALREEQEDIHPDAALSDDNEFQKASMSNALKKERENILSNGSFEETSETTSWVWANGRQPVSWGTWAATPGNQKMSFEVAEDESEAMEGKNYLYIHSEDKATRIGINVPIHGIDSKVDYLCTFWMKTEDVEGTGLYARLSRLRKDNGKTESNIETEKIKGTTDGWIQYSFATKDLPSSNTEGLQIDIFAEYMSGSIWLDDIQIVPTYSITLNEKDVNMMTGDTIQLSASISHDFDEEILWYSKDPAIADVDEEGYVTAYEMGVVEIVAKTDDFHEAICKVSVEDGDLQPYYTAIRENWKNRLTGNNMENTEDEVYQAMMTDITEKAKTYWDSMEKGGNERTQLWSDINFKYEYKKTTANITEALGSGFSRIELMATAYSANGSDLYQNQELKEDIIGALEWVYKTMYNDTMSPQNDTYGNWWHWFIGMPQSLCNIVILMYDDMNQDLIRREARTLENFNWDPNERYVVCGGSKVSNAAGNLIDTSLVSALRSSIGETSKPLNMAKEALDKSIGFVSSGNGYYEDGSYIDHGNLAYTGGYGSTLLGGMEKILFIIHDSPWEMDTEELSSVFQWIWNGIRPLYADGAVMDMTIGRGIARPSTNGQTVGKGLLKPISHLVEMAPEEVREDFRTFAKTEIQAGLQYSEEYFIGMTVADMTAMRNLLLDDSLGEEKETYHKNFGAMDKAVYHGENFDLGISMYSKRMGNFEYGNNENRKGWHMSDGALYLHNGDQSQFADVYWPTVDPQRLAGITTDHTEGYIPTGNSWNAHVSSKDWVGGSSVLNLYGTVGMDFEGETTSGDISSLKAKKSWFTFPDGIVALGAGINSSEGKATETIVENRKAMEDAANTLWVDGEEAALTLGEAKTISMDWALLEGNHGEEQNIGYYFPEKTEVSVLKETRTGNWRDINTAIAAGSANDKEIIRSYISLAVGHGANPQNETYSYVLLPGRNQETMEEFANNPQVKILSNTEEVQAVEHTEYGVTGYNFWTAYEGEELEVAAQTPASVTLAEEDGVITAGISNPTQNEKDTIIILNKYYEVTEADDGVSVENKSGKTTITITGSKDFGKTYEVVLISMEKKLSDWQRDVEKATLEQKVKIQEILTALQSLDRTEFHEKLNAQVDVLLELIPEKLAQMEVVEEVVAPFEAIEEVTFENADEIEELLKRLEELTEEEAALLSDADKAKIAKLQAEFQKEEVRSETKGITVKAVMGTMDIRTTFNMTDRSDSLEQYQKELPKQEFLLSLFSPSLFLKEKQLSLEENPVSLSMKAPDLEKNERLNLYCFVSAARSSAALVYEKVSLTLNQDGMVTFQITRDGIYGFAVNQDAEPEPNPEPEVSEDDSDEEISDGIWIQNTNGWWFSHYNGTWPSSQWKWINGAWYHFNESGYMQTGWILDQNTWYYLTSDGSMVSNQWVFYKEQWYFLAENGAMLASTSVTWKGVVYYLGADGVMLREPEA